MENFIPYVGNIDAGAGVPPIVGANGMPFIFTDMEDFRKAVTVAGYGTDMATLTGGGALRMQSLEATLLQTVQDQRDFILWNLLDQSNATATVDEFTIKNAIGGFPGSGFNDELGVIAQAQGDYARKVGFVKYLMTMREVSIVQKSQKTLIDTIAVEKTDGVLELLTSSEHGLIYGDSGVVPQEFDGYVTQVLAANVTDLVVDMAGTGLSYVAKEIINAAAAVSSYGNWGTITDMVSSLAVQASELDQKLDPAFRVVSPNGQPQKIGTPVKAISTSSGDIRTHRDKFIREGGLPWEVAPGTLPAIVTAAALTPPTINAQPVAAAGTAANKFLAAHAGNYYYGIESVGKTGRSTCLVTAQVAVTATQKVTIVLNNPADANVTGFFIHRSRRNGTNAKADLREMIRIPRTAGATTTFVDENARVPGTSVVLLLNLTPGSRAINVRRLLPLMMFPLYVTNTATQRWAQLLFFYLRMAKPKQHAIIINVLPGSAAWKPF